MKKTNLFILLFLHTYLIFSQNSIVTYNASLKIDIDSEKYTNKQKEYLQVALSSSHDIQYALTIQKEKSIYKKTYKLEIENQTFNLTEVTAGKGVFYTDNKQKENIETRKAFGETFLIYHKPIQWKLLNKTKIINNYKCRKATAVINVYNKGKLTKKNVTAWYTQEIPLNFGPKFYNGLPGLIIELQEGKLNLKVINIKFNINDKVTISKPANGQIVTLKDFNKIIREIREKRF